MKAVFSSTYDDKYFYFIPIAIYCWDKIGVESIVILPNKDEYQHDHPKMKLMLSALPQRGTRFFFFKSPEHKEATYSQVSRVYAAASEYLEEGDILILGDVDMVTFGDYLKQKSADFDVFGYDLVPEKQYPICFVSATVKNWRSAMQINGKSLQECLDKDLGHIECEHFRGNYWGFDQEKLYNMVSQHPNIYLHGRAKPGTQFATRRVDRDNMFYEENINDQLIDAHLWRPGYSEENFPKILDLLQRMYPNENFEWLIEYTRKYRELL